MNQETDPLVRFHLALDAQDLKAIELIDAEIEAQEQEADLYYATHDPRQDEEIEFQYAEDLYYATREANEGYHRGTEIALCWIEDACALICNRETFYFEKANNARHYVMHQLDLQGAGDAR